MQLEGVYVPCVTPFTADDEVDLDAYAAVVGWVLDAGVQGIVPCGTTGEYYAMSADERLRVMAATMDLVDGRAQTIAGCNAGSTREVIRLAEAAAELGYDAIMLAAPHTSLPTQDELVAHFTAVATAVGLPIVLYNFPARAGVEIGMEALDRLADVPEVVAIKESSGDMSRFLAMRRLLAGRMQIACGSDDQAVDYLHWGVCSWIAGTANVLPRHHVAMVEAAARGDHDEPRRLFDAMLPWVQDLESGGYNQKVKLGLEHQGIAVGPVRAPLRPLPDDDAATMLRRLQDALAVEPAGPAGAGS